MLDGTCPALNDAGINPPSSRHVLCSRVNQPMRWLNLIGGRFPQQWGNRSTCWAGLPGTPRIHCGHAPSLLSLSESAN